MKTKFEIVKKNTQIVLLKAENRLLKKIIRITMKKRLEQSKSRFKSAIKDGTTIFNKLPKVKQVGVYAAFTA